MDADDPRAPTEAEWDALSEEQRAAVVAALPSEVPWEIMAPEGDAHYHTKRRALDVLGGYFQRIRRRMYLSAELAVYYPGERRFAPDILAVADVEPHHRSSWVVSKEGRGLDLIIEVHVSGDRRKDFERNVALFARLGVREYFVFDHGESRLRGYRLPESGARRYTPIIAQGGLFESEVLGVSLSAVPGELRFYVAGAALPETQEIAARLEVMVDDLVKKREAAEERAQVEAENARVEAERAKAEAERAQAEAERARAEAERAQAEAAKATAADSRARAAEEALAAALARLAELEGRSR